MSELTLSLDALLAWELWTPSLVPSALPPGPAPGGSVPPLRPPNDIETAIELPYRLLLSPDDQGRWDHQPRPVIRRGRVEQWHTRLAGRVRAVWSPDVASDVAAARPPIRRSPRPFGLLTATRSSISRLTSHCRGDSRRPSTRPSC